MQDVNIYLQVPGRHALLAPVDGGDCSPAGAGIAGGARLHQHILQGVSVLPCRGGCDAIVQGDPF